MTGADRIESYRARLEEFEQTLNRELYLYYSGQKSQLEIRSIYSDYSDFFSLESIQEATSALNNIDESFSSGLKSHRKIVAFLMDQHLDFQTVRLTQEIEQFEAKETLVWQGREISLSLIAGELKQESDASKRRSLHERYAAAQLKSELKLKKVALLRSTAVGLGFKNYSEARERITGVNFKQLLDSFDAALSRLEDLYTGKFRNSLERTLGISYQEVGPWDIAHWLKKNDEEEIFSKKNLLPVVKATIEELGIQPERSNTILLDMDRETARLKRPFCIPIRIPQEIRIVMLPGSGFKQYAALLHENGHAHSFAWVNASLPAEQRIWGDRALSEAYGFLLENLIQDPQWLERMLSFKIPAEFLHFHALFRMFLMRRCSAQLCFALRMHEKQSLESIPEFYGETMKSYMGMQYKPESWLAELPDGFEAADYLRGWILEAMLREFLRSKYGRAWFLNRSAAGFLKEIWETGQLYRADELCREIGFADLDPQILVEELSGGLQA